MALSDNKRVLFAAGLGTAIEYYDFHIYGMAAALVFGPLFFPGDSPAAQTLYAIMTFGLAFLARPLGAAIFGHFGDRIGRKSTLVASLMIMGVSTLAIAFLPTYAMIGWMAPALLCLLRIGQGLGLSGEWAGATLLVVESAPKGWENRFFAIMQLGAPTGFATGTAIFMAVGLLFDDAQFMAWGWRVPFLFSALLVILGLYVRLRIEETPAFRAAVAHEGVVKVPFAHVVRQYPGALVFGAAGVVATIATFYLATTYALAHGTGEMGYDRNVMLGVQLVSVLFVAAGLLISGTGCDRTSPRLMMGVGAACVILVGLLFGAGLNSGSQALAGAAVLAVMFAQGMTNSPLGGWMASLFPVRYRYTGVAIAFNIGALIGGALMPIAAQGLSMSGHPGYVGLVLSLAGAITLAGTILSRAAPEHG